MANETKSEKSPLHFSLKSLIVLAIFAAGLYFLIPKLLDEKEVFTAILKVKKPFLLLALAAEIISYIGSATLMGVILSRIGYQISFKDRFRLGSISAFAIHFFPVAGLGEGAVDYYFLRRRDVSAGSVLIMFILRSIFTYAAFILLFIISLLLVPSFPDLPLSPRIISRILFIIIISIILYIYIAFKNKERFYKLVMKLSKWVNKFLKLIHRVPIPEAKIKEAYDDVYSGVGLFAHRKRSFLKAIGAGLLYWIGDISCLYFVFLSLGYQPRITYIIFGYCISTLIGQISLIPGGLGITEGSMSLIYGAIGIPISLVVTAVLVFRFFSFWIWIPIGLISYITLKRANSNEKINPKNADSKSVLQET